MERCIRNRLWCFLTKIILLTASQYGFPREVSTGDAMNNLIKQIFNDLNNKKHILSAIFDLLKVFEIVNHMTLLRKPEQIGIRG